MSNIIRNKLIEVYNELSGATNNLIAAKQEIAEALRFNDVTNVSDTETFSRYAELIRRLKASNAMILEISIPESAATTAYKRTCVLPMYFGVDGNRGYSLNAIAKEILAQSPSTADLSPEEPEDNEEYLDHIITDVYGNEVMDGNYTVSMSDVETYLSPEEATEFLQAASNLGISVLATDEDGNFEPSTDATYSYTVDWGDGTPECIFDETKTYEENKPAIWHTYAQAGVYDISINGTYKRIYTSGEGQANFVEDGQFVTDSDGMRLNNENNYGMRNFLIAVMAWGNTLLNNMSNGFRGCSKLASIPMYDTTNSFADVTDFSFVFRRCTSLTSLPYNQNTGRGLFSNCEKATTFTYAFEGCSKLTEPIPERLIDGCISVTNVSYMFASCNNMEGGVPTNMFSGLTSLRYASGVFMNNYKMNGSIPENMFADCPNVTQITQMFQNCSGITGTIGRDFIGGLTGLTSMRRAFYNCRNITGITADAFYNLKADGINCRDAFCKCGLTELPQGLLESLTGNNLMMERMFAECTGLTNVASSALSSLKVANARGIFGGCTSLSSSCPDENPDWTTQKGLHRWFGAFALTNLSNISSVPFELGGDGNRRIPDWHVGAIVLDGDEYTLVDPANYTYDPDHVPVGIVYADVNVDSEKTTALLPNNSGNVVSWTDESGERKIYATVFNDSYLPWVSGQTNAVDIPSITQTTNLEPGYNKYTWDSERTAATLNPTRYCGEAYTKAINDYRVEQGMATYSEESGYVATESDVYPSINFINTYSDNGMRQQTCFWPDGSDLWDQYVMKHLIQKAINKIIAGGNGYTSSNCYSMRDNTAYWASAEGSSVYAWSCNTNDSILYYSTNKWPHLYVRPSFAIPA